MRSKNGGRRIRNPQEKDLVLEFLRFVRGLKPKAIMLENVPNLAKDHRMKQVLRELEGLGYKCNYEVLDAADYGVPQRRKRLILLAGRSKKIDFATKAPSRMTVRQAFAGLHDAGSSGDILHDWPEKRSPKVTRIIRRIPEDGGSRASLGKRAQLACHQKFDGFKDVYGRMSWIKFLQPLQADV